MADEELVEVEEEVETPEVPEEAEPEVVEPIPKSNDKAIAFRDDIVKKLEDNMPIVIADVVKYVESLMEQRSHDGEPTVTLNAELLGRAHNKGSIYPDEDKETILTSVSKLYKEAGYDVKTQYSETKQATPTYLITINRGTSRNF